MTLKINSAEGGTNGADATFANSGGASGDAFTPLFSNGTPVSTIKWSSADTAHGSRSVLITPANAEYAFMQFTGFDGASVAVRFYVKFPTLPAITTEHLEVRVGSSICRLYLNSTNKWSIQDTSATQKLAAANTLTANTWYRVELRVAKGTTTTDGTIAFAYYALDSTTPIESLSSNALNTGTANFTEVRVGKTTASASTATIYFDDIAINDATTNFIGPVATNSPPVSSAGSNKTVAVNTAISLTGTDSDSDGTVTNRAWTYVDAIPSAAPAPTTGATNAASLSVTPTAPGKFRYKYVVTDNSGALSSDSFVYVFATSTTSKAAAVTGSTEYTAIGGGDLIANVGDGSTTTGVSYPSGATAVKSIRYRLTPLPVLTSISIPVSRKLSIDGSGSLTVRLYQGSTVRYTWTDVVSSTTLGTTTLTNANGTGDLTAITDWTELDLEFTWGS